MNFIGLDGDSDAAQDDIVPTQGHLHLPVNRPAVIQLSTRDVIHSFFIPVMRVKQDAVPGMRIPVWFTPTQAGSWEIACAQLCGNSHYEMKGFVHIHTQEGYEAYMAALALVQQIDDYDYTLEAEKTMKRVVEALKAGDPESAEKIARKAKTEAEAAYEEKQEAGDEDDDWGDEW